MTCITIDEAKELRRLCEALAREDDDIRFYSGVVARPAAEEFHSASRSALPRLLDELAEMRAENFALAADQCHAGYGDEGGSHRCMEVDAAIARAEKAEAERDEARNISTFHNRGRVAALAREAKMREALHGMLALFGNPHKGEYLDGGASFNLALETVKDARAALKEGQDHD